MTSLTKGCVATDVTGVYVGVSLAIVFNPNFLKLNNIFEIIQLKIITMTDYSSRLSYIDVKNEDHVNDKSIHVYIY